MLSRIVSKATAILIKLFTIERNMEKKVWIKTPSGKNAELSPEKVWSLAPKGRKGVKIGLFKDPETGRYFRHKLPDDY